MPRQAESRRRWARLRGYAVLRATGLVAILALATWVPAAGQEGAEARVTADRLNFREECGMSSPVLGVLTRDETVTLLGSELGTWVRVRDEAGVEGCVSTQYLEIESTGAAMEAPMTESATSSTADLEPYAWADLTDPDSAEIVDEIEELEADLAATSDPEEQEDLSQEIAELEDDLRARQEELAEEREEAAREAREAELAAQEEAAQQAREAQGTEQRASGSSDWTGFYLGVNVGYGFGDEVAAGNNLGTVEEDIDGFDGGVQIGYNHQFGRFVLGGEADYQFSGQSGTVDLGPLGFPGSTNEDEYVSYGTVRVRAGSSVGRALLYATGGYAYADYEIHFSGPIAVLVPDQSVSLGGLAAGIGAESRLTAHLSLKAELLYHEFDDEPEVQDGEFYSARVGLNWKP